MDMFLMICRVVGINEDVVEADDHAHIPEITEDVVHEMLESCGSIGKSEGHNEPFKRTIAGVESSFPFITICNTDKVIGMSEIDGGIDTGFTHSGKEVGNEWKGISIPFGYFIEASEIYTEAEGFIFLEGKDYRSTMGGGSLADKSGLEMVIKEVAENFKLGLRERIHRNNWQRSSIFQINFEIIMLVQG